MNSGLTRRILLAALVYLGSFTATYGNVLIYTFDFDNSTAVTDVPTVNYSSPDTNGVYLQVKTAPLPADEAIFINTPKGYTDVEDKEWLPSDPVQSATLSITFRKCQEADLESRISVERKDNGADPFPCPGVLVDGPRWVSFSSQPDVMVIEITKAKRDKPNVPLVSHTLPIEQVRRSFALIWSAGLALFNTRDDHYRLSAVPNDADHSTIVKLKPGSYPYKLAAFAHYAWVKHPWTALTFGIATDVPVSNLSVMLGLSAGFRPLQLGDTAYLTGGVAYTQRKRLSDDFNGVSLVSRNVSATSLVTNEYGFSAFLGLSFSFLGGQDQFKGAFTGKASKSVSTGQ